MLQLQLLLLLLLLLLMLLPSNFSQFAVIELNFFDDISETSCPVHVESLMCFAFAFATLCGSNCCHR